MNPQIKPTQLQMFINGKFVSAKSGKTFSTINPSTEEVIAQIWEAGKQDVDDAVQAAVNAFQPDSSWRKMSSHDRGQLMFKLADIMEKNTDELASLECLDTGKSFTMCKMIDLPYAISAIRYYAGWSDKITGQTISIPGPYFCYTRREPVGVCAQIIPWNVPLIMLAWKLGPALASGCTLVLKPAEQTPLTALKVAEYITEVGFPDGTVNIITGFGETGAMLVDHPKIDKIAFTGSTEVGQIIMQRCSINNLKKVSLELGGKSPLIVMDDADIDEVLNFTTMGVFFNSGQVCFCSSRIFVHEKIYDEFVKRQVERAKTLKVGSSWEPDTLFGPVVDETQFKKVLNYMQKGQEQGAKLECGGIRKGNKGYFIEATVFSNVEDNNIIAKEEIFGPSMQILKFKSLEEVIQRANNTFYGLAAGIFTKNIETYLKFVNSLQAGLVFVNCYGKIEPQIPFGGYKMSGFGKEMGEEGLKPYLQSKVIVVKQSDDTQGF